MIPKNEGYCICLVNNYFENPNIIGSISLLGGTIDDLTFKKYTKTLNGSDNVTLLNPRSFLDGYLVDTGWATNNKNIDVPNYKTVWKIEEHDSLLNKRVT